MKPRALAITVARVALALLFVLAGVLKLRDPTRFALEIANYQLLPALAPYLALVLPSVEVVAGGALLLGPRSLRLGAALLVAFLLLAFTGAVATVVARGINVECGCFGGGGGPVTLLTLIRDVALLALAGFVVWGVRRGYREPARRADRRA